MFDGILKSKFYSKCKSAIKKTKIRLEIIKRKRYAMKKYLKNDIAYLLEIGLDMNAYGRAKGLLIELNITACYNLIEQFCGCIINHLSKMNKQRECPEECIEAVQSLIFAAARFADLPELRDLRSIFIDRYGNSLEAYVNKEFVEKLKATPPTKDMKLQLLQDIALDSGLEWDSKALEQKLYNNPPAFDQALKFDEKKNNSNAESERNVSEEKADDKKPLEVDHHRYNSKQSPCQLGKEETTLNHTPSSQEAVGNTTKNRSKDCIPARATSLPQPAEKDHYSKSELTVKIPDTSQHSGPETRLVHPKLPDYDDFVARLAALRN